MCKHIYSVKYSLLLRKRVTEQNLNIKEEDTASEKICPKCSSVEIVSDGFRKTKRDKVQRYLCKVCHYRFIPDNAFVKIKATPQAITASLDLYFKGCSLHDIRDHLKQFYNVNVSHVAILKWIKKYVALMKEYTDTLTPSTSGIWHVDEMMVKVRKTEPMENKGNYDWLWNLMDHETRFLLASQIHKKREIDNARRVFQEAKKKAKSTPIAVVHDGLQSYDYAFRKEFYTMKQPRVTSIRSVGASKKGVNQLVERLHGTIREREKVMRGMDHDESAQNLLDGAMIFYNFIRPHMSLKGKTPAEEADIRLDLDGDRWKDLITKSYVATKQKAKHE